MLLTKLRITTAVVLAVAAAAAEVGVATPARDVQPPAPLKAERVASAAARLADDNRPIMPMFAQKVGNRIA